MIKTAPLVLEDQRSFNNHIHGWVIRTLLNKAETYIPAKFTFTVASLTARSNMMSVALLELTMPLIVSTSKFNDDGNVEVVIDWASEKDKRAFYDSTRAYLCFMYNTVHKMTLAIEQQYKLGNLNFCVTFDPNLEIGGKNNWILARFVAIAALPAE